MNIIFDFMLVFDKKKFGQDVAKKINGENIKDAAVKCDVSYPSLWRAANAHGNISVQNLVKLLQWLKMPLENYLKKEATMKK